jgi:Domain of unknown function (DUF1772)
LSPASAGRCVLYVDSLWWRSGSCAFSVPKRAALMHIISYTLGVVLPVNKRLEATPPGSANAETRALVETWGKLHAVRSALGLAATLIYLWAALET